MILEGLVTTTNPDGTPHLAPMGPRVDGPHFNRFLLRPFPTSHTYRNLLHLGGTIAYTPQAITVTLHRPQTPKLALLIEEINTNPPRMPGDHRPITYTLTTL